MIVALRGALTRWDEERSALWIEAGGVTYEVAMPAFAGDWVGGHAVGDEVQVFTYEYASERQPAPTLFGFPRLAEREFFRKFIEVPDIGPAKAVRALTRPVSDIARWVEAEDARALRQLPGIGDRLAQTIIAHLRGKLVQEALLQDRDGHTPVAAPDIRAD
nr:OB-fold domain-containing protein [Dehalococcoidia bacterium]